MTKKLRLAGFTALACASHLLVACAAPPTIDTAATPQNRTSSLTTMNQTSASQKHIVERIVEALKTERMLQTDFFQDASLQAWFGAHQRTSTPSPLKEGVQRERLVFEEARLSLARQLTGRGFSFNLEGPDYRGLTGLRAEDLIGALGEPQKKVDFIAQQLNPPPQYPASSPDHIISPQPVRKRGKTTHPMGNHDLYWEWTSDTSTARFSAEINGDGSVDTINGRQDRRQGL